MSSDSKNEAQTLVKKALDFAEDSKRFINRCTKPSTKGNYYWYYDLIFECLICFCKSELKKTAAYCAIGFAVMGVVGYLIKLVFIPINNIILSKWVRSYTFIKQCEINFAWKDSILNYLSWLNLKWILV